MPRRPADPAPVPVESGTVSLYVRLSREAGETNLSREGMLADLRALAEREGLRVVAEHLDDGISGARRDRPAFRAWLDDALTGRASALAAWHVDRMTREGTNAAALILDVVEGKDPGSGKVIRPPVRLLDVSGLDSESDPEGFRWRFVIGAEVARAERARMVARNTAKAARLRERGGYLGGLAPFGFRRERDGDGVSVLVVEPREAEALRAAGLRLMAGEPLTRVALDLSTACPPRERSSGRHATAWSRVTLRQSLTSDAARSMLWSAAEWAALSAALEPKARRHGERIPRRDSRLLSGLLACHSCGVRLQVAARTDGSVTYRCQSRAEGRPCEAPVSVSALAVESWAAAEYLDRFGDLTVSFPVLVTVPADGLDEAEEALQEAARRLTEPGADVGALAAEVARLAAERDRLAALPPETVQVLPGDGRTRRDAWADAPVPARRDLVALALSGRPVVLGPGRRGPRGFDPSRVVGDPWPDA